MKTKTYDCVEMVETIQEEIQTKLELMSREEQLAYWHAQTVDLCERQRLLREGDRQSK